MRTVIQRVSEASVSVPAEGYLAKIGNGLLVLAAFIECVEKKAIPPIDTYDTASWMAITPLSEQSIKMGGAPVAIPDFTKGLWAMPREVDDLEFRLD